MEGLPPQQLSQLEGQLFGRAWFYGPSPSWLWHPSVCQFQQVPSGLPLSPPLCRPSLSRASVAPSSDEVHGCLKTLPRLSVPQSGPVDLAQESLFIQVPAAQASGCSSLPE